jgi:hypothetical protein
MIQPNEIMLGNLFNLATLGGSGIRIPGNEIYKVVVITPMYVNMIEHTKIPACEERWPQFSYADLSPIELTENYLIRFGFVEGTIKSETGPKIAWIKEGLGIENFFIIQRFSPDNNFKVRYSEYRFQEIKYVHQLQNLFFTKTLEFLKYN